MGMRSPGPPPPPPYWKFLLKMQVFLHAPLGITIQGEEVGMIGHMYELNMSIMYICMNAIQ